MFASLGSLSGYMDFTSLLSFGEIIINGKVLSTIFMTPWAPLYVTYLASAMELTMAFVAAAYVTVHATDAGVDFVHGLYKNYAKWSDWADSIAMLELVVVMFFFFWAFLCTVLALV
jgi:hypothetical protein